MAKQTAAAKLNLVNRLEVRAAIGDRPSAMIERNLIHLGRGPRIHR
jgi:hypothetical protein